MSKATSTAPVVLSTLFGLLQASPTLTGVQVLYGDTGQADRENVVLTGSVTWEGEDWSQIGARSREERYELDGFVHIHRPGDSQQQATERAYELLAVVETVARTMVFTPDAGMTAALSAAYGAGAAQIVNLGVRKIKALGWPGTEGQLYTIDFGVRVTARI